ncbi:MAG TPA: ubiquitin-like domain-containing protein [Candidatus Saccharimonadales bacterium]|nr:ubiquitin-like domain-containing protein [Candidatus Saccharimonadales bacterium]
MDTCYRMLKSRAVKWSGVAGLASLALLLLATPQPTHAQNERVVTFFHDGIQQTVVTDATTVEEALKRANISLEQKDSVEPARDTTLTAPSYDVNVYRAKPVTVIDGPSRYQVMSAHTSARQIAADAGLTLHNEDTYEFTRINDFITEGGVGLKMTIDRSVQVNLVLYGKPAQIRTQATTVGELLQEKGVKLGQDEGANVPFTAPITANMTVEVWRNGVQTVTEEQPVAFPTELIRDADKPAGYRQIQTPGTKGKKLVTYQVELKNGQTVSRKEIQSVVTEQPKKQVEVIGVKVGFSGAFQDALAQLRSCEGTYTSRNERAPKSSDWYYGAYQFNLSTWQGAAPEGFKTVRPDQAPPQIQDQAAYNLYLRRGWQPWPTCAKIKGLQDIYR